MYKKTVVFYYSKYGSTQKYAEYLAEQIGCEKFPIEKVEEMDLSTYDIVIFGSGLYAGRIKHKDIYSKCKEAKKILFTVGIADPESTDYSDILKSNFSEELLGELEIFHLRGNLDYTNMTLIHKIMMWALMKFKVEKIKPEKRTDEVNMMIETYGKKVDFTDLKSTEPILKLVKEQML